MSAKSIAFAAVALTSLVLAAGGVLLLSRNPLLDIVQPVLKKHDLALLQPLEIWVEKLGPPESASRRDGQVVFYWWPNAGLGVFTHPHFEAQSRVKAPEKWRVTSVYLPLSRNAEITGLSKQPAFNALIEFPEGAESELSRPESLYLFESRRHGEITLSNFPPPVMKAFATAYFRGENLVGIAVHETNLFSHYD